MTLSPLSEKPFVSVIVPSLNQGAFIGETLDSIIGQNYRPLEILVIDGGSTDGTIEVLHRYDGIPELTWISEQDRGVAEAVNKGLKAARGELCAIQSSDDCYLDGALAAVVDAFVADSELGLVYGDCVTVDRDGKELFRSAMPSFSIEGFLSKRTVILQPTAFFRRGLALELGGWDARFFNADTELWLRMAFRTKVRKLDRTLARHRVHDAQRDKEAAKIVESYWRMVESSDDLRKACPRLRRAAQCGKFLHAARYNPSGRPLLRRYFFWRAVAAYPEILGSLNLAGALLPGYYPLHRFLSRLKRFLKRRGRGFLAPPTS